MCCQSIQEPAAIRIALFGEAGNDILSGTVQDDLAADLLIGNAGQNWLFTGIGDRITDKAHVKKRVK
jgi:Ca2+-binding RTX toxin-like protein